MKETCERWKEQLLEAALTGAATAEFEAHLRSCASCSRELQAARARKSRLDELLPLVARGAEPPADFRARVLAVAETANVRRRALPWRLWTLAGATAAIVLLVIGVTVYQRTEQAIPVEELAAVKKLVEWRAPSDGLLRTPGQEILKTTPRLGQSYLNVTPKTDEEE